VEVDGGVERKLEHPEVGEIAPVPPRLVAPAVGADVELGDVVEIEEPHFGAELEILIPIGGLASHVVGGGVDRVEHGEHALVDGAVGASPAQDRSQAFSFRFHRVRGRGRYPPYRREFIGTRFSSGTWLQAEGIAIQA
jgi:hypothetical protein